MELVSAQYAHSLIDAMEDTLLAFPMVDKFAHLTVGGLAPLHSNQTT
jgi:hypothetical protein